MVKFIPKIILPILSLIISFYVLLFGVNTYLIVTGSAKTPFAIEWMLDGTYFWPDIVFWSKSWCDYSETTCNFKEEHYLSSPVEIFHSEPTNDKDECTKILFLGDSFTVAPWVNDKESYSAVFSSLYSENNQVCVRSYRMATGGANNSQELLYFGKHVKKLQPDLVIWQFYWNDISENPKEEIFTVVDGKLRQRMPWKNMLFLSGFLNQKIPFLRNSALGNHLLYLGEQEDPFSYWPFDFRDKNLSLSYSQVLIPKLIDEMDELSSVNNFNWFTTLAPLECQFVSAQSNCEYKSILQNELRNILQFQSQYISMEVEPTFSVSRSTTWQTEITQQMENVRFFNTIEDRTEIGGRHLSKEGNKLFGENLFNNYLGSCNL